MGKYVIARGGQMELVVEKSRFLCTLRRVASEAEAQAFVKEMKKIKKHVDFCRLL